MIYTPKIQKAIQWAIQTHELDQKQKRKGKDIPYITHPLAVGLILALAAADEAVVVAGILHDTLEDSADHKKVTKEMLTQEFGQDISDLVLSVTEQDKSLTWEERKREALNHIVGFSNNSILLKSADLISNSTELIADYRKDGEQTFNRFNAPKERILSGHIDTIEALLKNWPQSPLAIDLQHILEELNIMSRN